MEELKEFQKQVNEARKKGFLTSKEASKAIYLYKQEGNTEILEKIKIKREVKERVWRVRNAKWHELSELESLQTIVRQNRVMIDTQKEIKGWITFMGVITIIGIVGMVIFFSAQGV